MLLVKKCNFFHFLFSVKMRLEIRFNNVLDRKRSLFDYKVTIFQSPINRTDAIFFLYLFPVKIRLEKRFNNVLDKKNPLFDHESKIFQRLKNRIFPKGLTHTFGQKMHFFFLIRFRSKKD